MKKLLRVPSLIFLLLSNVVGKIAILATFIVGSGFYWLTIGVFAFVIWTFLLIVTFFWTVVEVFIGRMKNSLTPTPRYSKSVARGAK